MDYNRLNKVFMKYSHLLLRLDHLVNVTSGHEWLSFLDAFSGYHQISKAKSDQEKKHFIIDFGTYYYIATLLDSKNVGATYRRIVNKVFRGLIGYVIKAYVNDMVVKSAKEIDYMTNLQHMFVVVW